MPEHQKSTLARLKDAFSAFLSEESIEKARTPMQIQTLIFDKGKFDHNQAVKWAKDHSFSSAKVDETESSLRLRQKDPSTFKKMRTISLTDGVKAVVGKSDPSSSDVHVPSTEWKVSKDTGETESGDSIQPKLKLDLGSGEDRAEGFIGMDLYPHDDQTVVQDLTMGIPLPDECASEVRMVNSLHHMEGIDPKALLSEIQRVLMPGGQFVYEGPNEIYNYPSELVKIEHEVLKSDSCEQDTGRWYRQQFTRLATPDAATANDSEPRIGISNYDQLPSDALLAMDALGYTWSDATSSGRGNRLHGYPSQGALAKSAQLALKALEIVGVRKSNLSTDGFTVAGDPGVVTEPRRVSTVAVLHKGSLLMGKRRDNGKWTCPGGHCDPGEDHHAGALREVMEETGIELDPDSIEQVSEVDKKKDAGGRDLHVQAFKAELKEKPSTSMLDDPDGEVERWRWVDTSNGLPPEIRDNLHVPAGKNILLKAIGLSEAPGPGSAPTPGEGESEGSHQGEDGEPGQGAGRGEREDMTVPIVKMDKVKQIVYGVVLEPNSVDAQEDWMPSEEIEATAHKYLEESRVVGSRHQRPIKAVPVESYVAPCDFQVTGQYGDQLVKKGSWVLGVKVLDPSEWAKVENGDYEGFSIGGFGLRKKTG